MRVKKILTGSRTLKLGTVFVLAAAGVVATATPAFAAAAVLTLGTTQGPAGGGNTIVATTPTTAPTFIAGVFVQLQLAGATALPATQTLAAPTTASAACWPTYETVSAGTTVTSPVAFAVTPGVAGADLAVFSANKLYITLPTTIILPATPAPVTSAKFHVCVYSGTTEYSGPGTGSPLIASTGATATQYSISQKAIIGTITPSSGPAKGGTQITVTGQYLTGATISLGGTPTLIAPVVAADGLSFTAITPAHVAESSPVLMAVTTAGGTTNQPNFFMYSNGIILTPNTIAATSANLSGVYVEVAGVGFSRMTFGGATNSTNAHVYLHRGTYDRTLTAGILTAGGAQKTNGQVAECTGVIVMTDQLLVCKMPIVQTLTRLIPATTVAFAVTAPTAGFTPADINMSIIDTVPGGSSGLITAANRITAISSPTAATLAVTTGAGAGPFSATIGPRPLGTVTTTGAVLTAVSGNFTTDDVGRVIVTAGGTFGPIASYTDATHVVLAAAPTTPLSTTATANNLLGDGTYTVTVVSNGSTAADPDYSQSIVSSGSTFTVAAYVAN